MLYRGYDGAGDVEIYTQGFVNFFDLSVPMDLPVAEWVISLEVGEHIPHEKEGMMIRNIHAHNCKGVMLSWGIEGQEGINHINNHPIEYLIDIFNELGYEYDKDESERFRSLIGERQHWFKKNFLIFHRSNPLC